MKPSERIKELAIEQHHRGIDPYLNGGVPDVVDWIQAILQYLDEKEKL